MKQPLLLAISFGIISFSSAAVTNTGAITSQGISPGSVHSVDFLLNKLRFI